MVKRLRESTDNTFYCAEITYDKSGRNICVYTTDIKEVQRSTKPKDEMKVEGGFMVRRKYFRSREEAESFIDSQDKCMTINIARISLDAEPIFSNALRIFLSASL